MRRLNTNLTLSSVNGNLGFNYISKEMNSLLQNNSKTNNPDIANQVRESLQPRIKNLAIINMLIDGYTAKEIEEELIENGWPQQKARKTINRVAKTMDKTYEKLCESAAEDNMRRLHNLINEAAEDGDRTTVIRAIDLINKIQNLYTTKMDIKQHSDINISFDGE